MVVTKMHRRGSSVYSISLKTRLTRPTYGSAKIAFNIFRTKIFSGRSGNFCRSSVEYALISNHSDVAENVDIPTGGFRHVDLTLPPFYLPAPLMRLSDIPIDRELRYVGVWKRQALISHAARTAL